MSLKNMSKIYLKQYKTIILSLLSFILGCTLTINLSPIDRTCKLENTDREYNIMKNSKLKSPDLIVLILSAPKNSEKRNAVRETWLKLRTTPHDGNDTKFKIKHYFVVGSLNLNVDDMYYLTSEQSKYNDILIVPVYDSFKNLTEKVIKSFVWLNEQIDLGLNFKYVLKCDDDSFVRIDNLIHELIQIEIIYVKSDVNSLVRNNNNLSPYISANVQVNEGGQKRFNNLMLYWGYFNGNAKIHRTGKYKETEWILCDNYIPYALGGGYLLSRGLVTYIAKNSDNFRYYHSEDVSVGTWLAPVKDLIRIHDRRFDVEWVSRGCQNYYLISHNLTIKQITKLYSNIVKTGQLCDSESRKKPDYLYNWTVSSSKCCNRIN